ncbi:MAG: type II toxin-antitoxin system HicA family toxin [Desulfuromonadales bacterium]
MSKQEKLLQRFKAKPVDFRWSDLQSLLAGFGYEMAAGGKTGGSRVRFLHPERPPIIMHKPHPTPVLKRYQVEQILEFLKKEGLV